VTEKTGISINDLSIPLYLDQKIVFDLLAVFENGFSNMYSYRESENSIKEHEFEKSGKLDANIFSFFKISFGGEADDTQSQELAKEVSGSKFHTPASLFWKLRNNLLKFELIKLVESVEMFDQLSCGDFVEFEAIIKKNPLKESFDTIINVFELIEAIQPFVNNETQHSSTKSQNQRKNPINVVKNPMLDMKQGFIGFRKSLLASNDMYGEIVNVDSGKVVIVTKDAFYNDSSIQDLINGQFKILGRITQILSENDCESIDLLRNTSFKGVPQEYIKNFFDDFNERLQTTISVPPLFNIIKYPAFQIIPICIFR
jgi:hypothetical protein